MNVKVFWNVKLFWGVFAGTIAAVVVLLVAAQLPGAVADSSAWSECKTRMRISNEARGFPVLTDKQYERLRADPVLGRHLEDICGLK